MTWILCAFFWSSFSESVFFSPWTSPLSIFCLGYYHTPPHKQVRRINVSRWPFVLHGRRGKCSFSTDLRKLSCSSFQSSNYRQPSQRSTLQNTEIKQLFAQGSSWAQTGTFLLIPGKSWDCSLGWLVDSVDPGVSLHSGWCSKVLGCIAPIFGPILVPPY